MTGEVPPGYVALSGDEVTQLGELIIRTAYGPPGTSKNFKEQATFYAALARVARAVGNSMRENSAGKVTPDMLRLIIAWATNGMEPDVKEEKELQVALSAHDVKN